MTDETNPLACTWQELKMRGKQFVDMAPAARNMEELDGLWSGFVYGWLNLTGAAKHEEHQAQILLHIMAKEKLKHELRIEYIPPQS